MPSRVDPYVTSGARKDVEGAWRVSRACGPARGRGVEMCARPCCSERHEIRETAPVCETVFLTTHSRPTYHVHLLIGSVLDSASWQGRPESRFTPPCAAAACSGEHTARSGVLGAALRPH